MTAVWAFIAVIGLLALNGLFVAAEFSLLATRRSRMEQLAAEGSRTASAALASLRELSVTMAGAQLGITMASLGIGAVAEPTIAHGLETLFGLSPLPEAVARALGVGLGLAIVVLLHMVVGEMAPKSWAISHPERSSLMLVRPFRLFILTFRPLIRLLNASANGVVRLLGQEPQNELAMAHSPHDLSLLLEESAAHGLLGADQQALLSRAIDLSELDAEAAMVPRVDVVAVDGSTSIDDLERVASTTGRSRIPVYRGDLDRIQGVLHVKDLLAIEAEQRTTVTAADLARPPLLTPESRPLEQLMRDMRQSQQHIAVVVDEYGGVSGLVALEDLLEELIGNFEDESDRAEHGLHQRPGGTIVIPGQLRPDEFSEATDIDLGDGPWETVAGYLITQAGHLPSEGDVIITAAGRFHVTRTDGYRIVELELQPPDSERPH